MNRDEKNPRSRLSYWIPGRRVVLGGQGSIRRDTQPRGLDPQPAVRLRRVAVLGHGREVHPTAPLRRRDALQLHLHKRRERLWRY